MLFTKYAQKYAHEIEEELDRFLKIWQKEVRATSPKLLPLTQTFIDSCRGGKRLRGILVKLGYELAGGKKTREILKPAAAYEIFQAAILAHDDIIDQSPLRRGKPSLYKKLGGDHYGVSQAIALADTGFFLATRLIGETRFPEGQKNKALAHFSQSTIDTALGEVLDIELPRLKTRSEKDVITIHRLKTAYYTSVNPLVLGGIFAGARGKLLGSLGKFGENLGLSFGIQDDILGVFGDEKTLGKSVVSDIEEGKNTLLITYAEKHATGAQRRLLKKHYGTGKIGKKELAEVRKVFEDSGSLAYSKAQAQKYVEQAKKIIPEITKEPEKAKLLWELSDFLINREK